MAPVLYGNTVLDPNKTLPDGSPFGSGLRPGAVLTDRVELHASGSVVIGFPLPSDIASAGAPAAVTAAVGIAPGSVVRIVKYCINAAGKITLVLSSTDRSAVRVHVPVAEGATANWSISVLTPSVSVDDVHTDYVVSSDENRSYVTLLEGALSVTPNGAPTTPIAGRQTVAVDNATRSFSSTAIPDGVVPTVDDPAPRVAAARIRPAITPVAAAPTPPTSPATPAAVTTTIVPGAAASATTPVAAASSGAAFFPPPSNTAVRLRVCFSAALLRAQPVLAQIQQTSYPVEITPIMKGRLIRGWQLRSTGYPGTLTGQGQWNGKTLRVTSWSVGAPATRGTAALSFNPTTRALIGAWKASKNGAGAWKLSLGEPPTC